MQRTRPGGAGASRAHAVVSGERCASPARFRGPQRGEVPRSGTEGQWSHRACLRGAGLAPGVSRGVPWGLPESPSSEEQGLRPTGTAQESRDMEVWEMQTPRHRLPHDVTVLTSEFLPRPQFVHLGNKPPPPTLPHLRDPRALARPPAGCHSAFKHYAIGITNYRQNLPAHCQPRWGCWGRLARSWCETGLASPATSPPP